MDNTNASTVLLLLEQDQGMKHQILQAHLIYLSTYYSKELEKKNPKEIAEVVSQKGNTDAYTDKEVNWLLVQSRPSYKEISAN